MTTTRLAIHGGKPTFKEPINYSQPDISKEDILAVTAVLESGWIAGRSSVVTEFEEAVAGFTGYKYAVSVNSATTGLYLVYESERVFRGEITVAVPALTFVATMNAPLLAGFLVRINDVESDTLCLKPHKYNDDYHLPVAYAGFPHHVDSFFSDDAHRMSPSMNEYNTPSRLASVISTHAIKPLATGEGGVILTNSSVAAFDYRTMADHGHGRKNYGHNFRMSSLQAALGLSQLRTATKKWIERKQVAMVYRESLAKYGDKIKLQKDHENHSNHIFPIITTNGRRDWTREALLAEGVRTQIHYKPLNLIAEEHSQKNRISYGKLEDYPVAMDMWENGFSLPMHNTMTLTDAKNVMLAFDKIMDYLEK